MSQGPATPSYIFRGHVSTIQSLQFFASNSLLASGDSDGWIVIWSLSSKRPLAVWHAHTSGITGIKIWGKTSLVSHGRDHKLRVWSLKEENFDGMDTKLPVEQPVESTSKQPWLLHSLSVSALNFCTFSICEDYPNDTSSDDYAATCLIAAANGLDSGGVDIFQLPTENRVSQLPSDKSVNTGMVMAVALFYQPQSQKYCLVTGYEDGSVMLHTRSNLFQREKNDWLRVMSSKPHIQPVLALEVTSSHEHFISSSADASIAKFIISDKIDQEVNQKSVNTKHAGQQGLQIRSDDRIFATAGWDARIRIYSVKTLKELAVLKWHSNGCYSTAFAEIDQAALVEDKSTYTTENQSLSSQPSALEVIKRNREIKAAQTHWLAAGGKDGKISLWEIY